MNLTKKSWCKGLTKETDARVAKISNALKGKVRSPEHCRHISESKIGKSNPKHSKWLKVHSHGVNNPFYGKHHTDKAKMKIGNANRGNVYRRGMKQPQTVGENNPAKRPEVRARISQRVSETHWDSSLEKNANWKGGISFLPYKPYKYLRSTLNELDGNFCALCGNNNQYIGIHHIDYDKLNNDIDNLCILCHSCNSKVNKGREFWQQFLSKLVITRRKVSYGRNYRSNYSYKGR